MFEHKGAPLLPRRQYFMRILIYAGFSSALMGISLLIGMIGYRNLAGLGWVDAFLNAAMIMGGMGPVAELKTSGAKLFAGFYALYCGLVLLAAAGILVSPVVHRLFHKFHLEAHSQDQQI